ncbi:MAG: hypothetical protein AAGG50_15830, partial [Bacteroidota bacterium]
LLSRHRRIGSKDPRTVALRKVIDVTHGEGFVLLTRDGKIDWLLRLDGEAPLFATMVKRLLQDDGVRLETQRHRERTQLRDEEQQWRQRGRASRVEPDPKVQAKLHEAKAYAERVHAQVRERIMQDDGASVPRYRGALLFQPDRGETVYHSVPARWNADEALRHAVAANPRVPGDSVDFHRTLLDRQRQAQGEGTLYLTNTRLLLIDPHSDTVLFPLPTISGVAVGDGFVEVERAQHLGRVIHLDDPMEFARLLERLVWEAT